MKPVVYAAAITLLLSGGVTGPPEASADDRQEQLRERQCRYQWLEPRHLDSEGGTPNGALRPGALERAGRVGYLPARSSVRVRVVQVRLERWELPRSVPARGGVLAEPGLLFDAERLEDRTLAAMGQLAFSDSHYREDGA